MNNIRMVVHVVLVGGYGGMGRIFARIFTGAGCRVTVTGPTERKGAEACRELGVEYVRDNAKAARGADVVVITVPIAVTARTIEEVGPAMKSGAVLLDLTSVKEWPCELMARHAKRDVEVIGAHPVFGPRVGSIAGQVIVLTPVRGRKWLPWLKGILADNDARVVESTPREHDEVMAVVQGLTHFTYISVGKTFKDMGFDVRRSRQFASPVYDLMLDMIGRIIGQDPHLYAEIQMHNPYVAHVREQYMKAASELSASVNGGDESRFVEMMVEAARHFGDTERSMGRSDKAIAGLAAELKALRDMVGREVCLRHMYSGVTHTGIVESVSAEEVVLRDSGKSTTLKLSNLVLLPRAGLLEYKLSKYGMASKDYSVVVNEAADEGFICELLARCVDNVSSALVRDVFRSEKIGPGRKSVCFSVELVADDVKASDANVASFLRRIGGVLR